MDGPATLRRTGGTRREVRDPDAKPEPSRKAAIAKLPALNKPGPKPKAAKPSAKPRQLTVSARARIAANQRKRWAAFRKQQAVKAGSSPKPQPKKKGGKK